MLSVYAAERVDVLQRAILGQGRVVADKDLGEIGYSAARLAEILVVLRWGGIGGDIGVRVCAILVGRLLLLIDEFESFGLRIRALRLSRRAVLVQHD